MSATPSTPFTPSAAPAAPDGALRRTDVVAGALAMSSLLVTFVPFALLVGAAIAASSNPLAAWIGTWGIYGGAAQIALLQALSQGSSWLAAAAVGLLVNLRLAAYAAAMAPHWRDAPLRLRFLAGFLLTDVPWALANSRTTGRRGYYLGAAVRLYAVFPLMVAAAAYVGGQVGSVPLAELLPVLSMAAMVATQVREREVAWAVSVAAVVGAATAPFDGSVALLVAAAGGVAAGVIAERRS